LGANPHHFQKLLQEQAAFNAKVEEVVGAQGKGVLERWGLESWEEAEAAPTAAAWRAAGVVPPSAASAGGAGEGGSAEGVNPPAAAAAAEGDDKQVDGGTAAAADGGMPSSPSRPTTTQQQAQQQEKEGVSLGQGSSSLAAVKCVTPGKEASPERVWLVPEVTRRGFRLPSW
jgi:hypothetical protein